MPFSINSGLVITYHENIIVHSTIFLDAITITSTLTENVGTLRLLKNKISKSIGYPKGT